MKNILKSFTAGVIIGLAASTSAAAYDDLSQNKFEVEQRAYYAGAYLKIPFAGNRRHKEDDLKFGFTAGLNYGRQDLFGTGHRQTLNANVFDLSFNRRGMDRLSFAGTPIFLRTDRGMVFAADASQEEGGSGGNKWPWIFGIAAVFGATAILIADDYNDGGCVVVPGVSICSGD